MGEKVDLWKAKEEGGGGEAEADEAKEDVAK